MRTRIKQFAVVSTGLLAAMAFAYQATVSTLYKDGAIVSSNLKTVDGTLYVPVKDVATYLGGTLNVAGDRADIQSPAGATAATATTGGLPQTIAQDFVPPISTPASAIASASASPPPAPTELTGSLNQDVTFDGFSYRVTDIQYRDRDYKDQFDQRGTKLHPQWKTDKLAIVLVTVKNVGSQPGSPTIPGTSDFSIFDSQKVAYPTTAVDIRQAPGVLGTDYSDDTMDYGTPLSLLAPGGQLTYAVVGSLPKGSSVNMIRFHVSLPSFPGMQQQPAQPLVTPGAQPGQEVPQNNSNPPTNPDQNPSGADVTVNLSGN